ncbi:hypothetical protein FS837_009848 [Tulasnella sp. UAMH 9824]|nr:hypothetical protein FS837_009848 [Tulasnella sp. UAMH 9824]
MLSQLPTELKIIIVKNVERQTLPSLLRVSWAFHDIGQPVLYHTVALGHFFGRATALKRATRCLHTLATKPSIREAIRNFRVWTVDPKWVEEDLVDEFSQALQVVMPKLPNVVKVAFPGENWAPIRLQLSGHSVFQSLQHYSGPLEVLENIESPFLRSVHMMDSDEYESIHRALLKTSQSCGTTLRVVRIFTEISYREWENLLGKIPLLFPNLITLDGFPLCLSDNERVDKKYFKNQDWIWTGSETSLTGFTPGPRNFGPSVSAMNHAHSPPDPEA